VGNWYTLGLAVGIGLAIGIATTAILGANVLNVTAAAVIGAGLGALFGVVIGETDEAIACAIGAVLGSVAAAVAVRGALRRGATRFGTGAYLCAVGVFVALLALVPILGYVLAVAVPTIALRMRGQQAARFAGLRTLAK
jgi:hypothetical protein